MDFIWINKKIIYMDTELQIRGSKGYFSTGYFCPLSFNFNADFQKIKGISAFIFLKISIEIEADWVKILNEILDFSTEIKFRG